MENFSNGEEAGRWLDERLQTLEESVRGSAELRRLIQEGAREVLIDLDADPALFARDASDRLRRYTSRVSQTALARLRRDGFQMPVLERSSLQLLGRDAALGQEVLRAMVDALRAHTEACSDEGTTRYGDGRQSFTDASREIGRAMDEALERWTTTGPGRHRDSRLPWRRRRAQLLRPMDDLTFRKDARQVVQRQLDRLERALQDAGEGSLKLTMAKYYGDITSTLMRFLSLGDNLRERGPAIRLRAEQRLAALRREASQGTIQRSGDMLLMDDETLDGILDRLGVNSSRFLQRVDLNSEELTALSGEDLEEAIRGWVEAQLGGMASASLLEALGSATGDPARARQRLQSFLAQGQPLMHYNDDLPLQFEGGMRGQMVVNAETSDPSVTDEFRAACHQLGLPHPNVETVTPPRSALLQLRVIQFVAGLPLFSQVDRLMEMIETHRRVLIEENPSYVTGAASPLNLRDMTESADFAPLLPKRIERAFQQERALGEDPSGGHAIDAAIEASVSGLPDDHDDHDRDDHDDHASVPHESDEAPDHEAQTASDDEDGADEDGAEAVDDDSADEDGADEDGADEDDAGETGADEV